MLKKCPMFLMERKDILFLLLLLLLLRKEEGKWEDHAKDGGTRMKWIEI
jgi:hypothetical protein